MSEPTKEELEWQRHKLRQAVLLLLRSGEGAVAAAEMLLDFIDEKCPNEPVPAT